MKPNCNLVVQWSQQLLEGMALVMLSRATRAIDLHIVGEFCKEAIKCDKKYALPESERLFRIFDEQKSKEESLKENLIKISYLNVKSI